MLDTLCGLVLCEYVKSCKMTSEMILCGLSGNFDKQTDVLSKYGQIFCIKWTQSEQTLHV